jgi:hypothetical protein
MLESVMNESTFKSVIPWFFMNSWINARAFDSLDEHAVVKAVARQRNKPNKIAGFESRPFIISTFYPTLWLPFK